MRILPLLSTAANPADWPGLREVELTWDAPVQGAWVPWVRQGGAVHAVHFADLAWDEALLDAATAALALRLGPDFLVLEAAPPVGRSATSTFLRTLEGLLEATHPRGVKLALKPKGGGGPTLATLLKEVRGEAVGFCWHREAGDLESFSDRLFCAVGAPGDDFSALQATGFRWNLALAQPDAEAFQAAKAQVEAAHPPVLFPAEPPTHALGRALPAEEPLTFGRAWGPR